MPGLTLALCVGEQRRDRMDAGRTEVGIVGPRLLAGAEGTHTAILADHDLQLQLLAAVLVLDLGPEALPGAVKARDAPLAAVSQPGSDHLGFGQRLDPFGIQEKWIHRGHDFGR